MSETKIEISLSDRATVCLTDFGAAVYNEAIQRIYGGLPASYMPEAKHPGDRLRIPLRDLMRVFGSRCTADLPSMFYADEILLNDN